MNTQIVLVMEGGLIPEVIANSDVEVLTIDHDIEGGDPECIREIPQGDLPPAKRYVRFEDVTVDAPRVARLLEAAEP
jgi:hypothetical protein